MPAASAWASDTLMARATPSTIARPAGSATSTRKPGDVVGGNGARQALERNLADEARGYDGLDGGRHALAQQDLPVLGFGAEPGGKVHHRADRAVFLPAFEADAAERRIALGDAYAEADGVPAPAPRLGQALHGSAHGHREIDGAHGWIGAGERIVEEDQDSVAHESLDGAAAVEDQRTHGLVIAAQESHHVLGLGGLGESREAPQIAHQRDDLAPMALHDAVAAGAGEKLGHLRRNEALQFSHPLDLAHLRRDPLLESPIPRRKL